MGIEVKYIMGWGVSGKLNEDVEKGNVFRCFVNRKEELCGSGKENLCS